jgi:hypothetical protein
LRKNSQLKKDAENVEIKKVIENIGHHIKENTELAEHETGMDDVKKDAKSAYNKMKKLYRNSSQWEVTFPRLC